MTERHVERVHTESVVLDIGDDVGALILYTTPDLVGKEIEVSPKSDAGRRTHTDVHERVVAGRTLFTAVYPALPTGEYTIWDLQGKPSASVTITGGQVAEVEWPPTS